MPIAQAEEPVLERVVSAAQALRLGDGLDPQTTLGPVVSAQARDRIMGMITKGEQEGAKLVLDGRNPRVAERPRGYFVGPTLFNDVQPEMSMAREEVFGPVVSMVPLDDLDQAIALINASPYGNAASLYTTSGPAAREFRYRVQAGNIGINVGVAAPVAYFPFGGMKKSFFGTLHGQGRDAVRFFTESKVVITRWI
jgi:malonate-semialdehyde dehydrogenase (acetylating)/methylmalonate-semialdehyde dehydrogenase